MPMLDDRNREARRWLWRRSSTFRGCLLLVLLASVAALSSAPGAQAASPAAGWTVHSFAIPSRFSATDNTTPGCAGELKGVICDAYQVTFTNAGAAATDGTPVTVSDEVPAGLTVQRVALVAPAMARLLNELGFEVKEKDDLFPKLELLGFCSSSPVQCTTLGPVKPDETIEMSVFVQAPSGTGTLKNVAHITGGGAPDAAGESENPLGGPLPSFGPAAFSAFYAGPDGRPDTQAGDHPYEFTTRVDLRNLFRTQADATLGATSVQDPKDISVDLPLGFLGDAQAAPQCTFAELSSHISAGEGGCKPDTIVGRIFTEPINGDSVEGPIYNMVPEKGLPAELGFVDLLAGSHVLATHVVPTPSGYVLRSTASDLPQIPLTDIVATLYGDPAGKDSTGATSVPFFTNPSACDGPLTTTVHMDSWLAPGRLDSAGQPDLSDPNWVSLSSSSPHMSGCDKEKFTASLEVKPDTTVADSPAGVDVTITVPQTEQFQTLATPPLKKALVTLPAGFSVDPSAAAGLGACTLAQIALDSATPPTCPDASKIGTVELVTPLIAGTLHGSIYLAAEHENPFGSLLAGYIVVDDPATGVVVKIPGELKLDPATGQITGVFDNNPQLPFSTLRLHFKGGPHGSLATPEACGQYSTTAILNAWSAPALGFEPTPFGAPITSGCVSGFAPTFTAGTTNTQAGAHTPFVMSFSRSDTDQPLAGLTVSLPPGLLANIAGVPLCTDAQVAAAAANESGAAENASPSCPAASQIGTVQAAAGPGPTPYFVSGRAYLTGPYNGGPYGIAVVVPAIAGPFDLGNVVVRASLRVDPSDGHVTAVSDPFPTIKDGIPVRLRRVDISVDRPGFTFNPTSCEPMSIAATLTSTGGLSAAGSSRFQVGGCAALPFKPRFTATTEAKTSRVNGASLTVDIAQTPGEADIRKVNVQLPLALPSRLTTLHKACTEAQFNQGPQFCPPDSIVGSATANTPVLATPLSGPAYLVSHGGAAFPDLEYVLQGSGVTIVLDGKTDIKKGITYSKFETVPDAPITSFHTVLPEGPKSILAAFGNLCTQPLRMPTTIVAQSGTTITQTTPIEVNGCPGTLTVKARRKGNAVVLTVTVPGAGTLTASGKGLHKARKQTHGRETVQLLLSSTRHRSFKARIKLTFKAAGKATLSKTLTARA